MTFGCFFLPPASPVLPAPRQRSTDPNTRPFVICIRELFIAMHFECIVESNECVLFMQRNGIEPQFRFCRRERCWLRARRTKCIFVRLWVSQSVFVCVCVCSNACQLNFHNSIFSWCAFPPLFSRFLRAFPVLPYHSHRLNVAIHDKHSDSVTLARLTS